MLLKSNIKPIQCIIIGGGLSINEGIEKGLWNKLKNKFAIGCNYIYKIFDCTINTYVDYKFQDENKEDLINLPLNIACKRRNKYIEKLPNTFYFENVDMYNRDMPFKQGIYNKYLAGLWSLSIAIKLLDEGEIFLLGFDAKTQVIEKGNNTILRNNFHHINEIKQKNNYNTKIKKINRKFEPYIHEDKCKIYNVCPESNIVMFDKINYDTFFKKLNGENFAQEDLREKIREALDG